VGSRDPAELNVSSRLAADVVAEIYQQQLPKHARGRLLDLGCGKVPLFALYRPFVSDIVCVDWHDSEHIDFVADLTDKLPFDDGEFDTIVLSDVLEHIAAPDRLWREMARVLKHGGRIILNVPFFYWVHEQPHDYYRYTEFALARFVRESGLRLLLLVRTGGSLEVVTDIVSKHVVAAPLGKTAASMAQAAVAVVRRTRLGMLLSERTSRNFPFGYFLVAQKPF
jgi:SAM-dependent methyltransferase